MMTFAPIPAPIRDEVEAAMDCLAELAATRSEGR